MIWKTCTLYRKIETDKDILGNPIYTDEVVMETKARHTPWSNEQISLEGREVTSNTELYALRTKTLPECDLAEIDGIKRKIEKVIDLNPRYIVVQVRKYKEANGV